MTGEASPVERRRTNAFRALGPGIPGGSASVFQVASWSAGHPIAAPAAHVPVPDAMPAFAGHPCPTYQAVRACIPALRATPPWPTICSEISTR